MKVKQNLRVRIDADAMERIWHWTDLATGEFSCLGTVSDDIIVGHPVEVFHQCPKGIPVGGDQDGLAGPEVGNDGSLEVRDEPGHHIGQALGQRATVDVGVTRIGILAVLAAALDRRRRGVVAATPLHELVFAVLRFGRGLVQPLQRTVVAFVEPPVAVHRNPVPVGLVQCHIRRGDGTPQERGVHNVGQAVEPGDQLAGAHRLGAALLGQVDVHPTGELIGSVPLAFAVAEQDQCAVTVSHSRKCLMTGPYCLASSPSS